LARDMGAMQRIDAAMFPLHYGTWAFSRNNDLIVKSLWFLFGLGMTGLAISGLIIYYKRTSSATKKLLPQAGSKHKAIKAWWVLRPWGGPMSGFKYVNWAFIGMVCFGFTIVLTLQSEGLTGSGFHYKKQQVGNWSISLNAVMGFLEKDLDPIQAGRQTTIFTNIEKGNPDGIKFMHVKVRKPRTTRAPGMVVHGAVGMLHAHMPVPKKLKEGAELWLTVEDWQGNFYQVSWPLMPDGRQTVDLRKADEAVAAAGVESDDEPATVEVN
ncbi:MAG: PepSY-associated TM helix domain-containing protein, partial [Pseudomonadota bacterium]